MNVQQFAATISMDADFDYGEGGVCFSWVDSLGYSADLDINLDGWCSREMPIRSGQGPPELVKLERNRIQLRFSPDLAEKLELDEEIEFTIDVDNKTFQGLNGFRKLW